MSKYDAKAYWKKKDEEKKDNSRKTEHKKSFPHNNTTTQGYNAKTYFVRKELGFDSLQSDLTSLATTIGNAYSGWQAPETMQNTKSSIQSMYDRLGKYQEYQKQYGGTDLSELHNSYKAVLDEWDTITSDYAKYSDAESYTNEKATLRGLYGLSSDEIKQKWEQSKILDEANKGYNLVSKQSEKAITDADKKIYAEGLKREEAKREEFLKGKGYTYDELQKSVGNYVSGDIAYTTSKGQNITWKDLYENTKYQEDHNARYKEISSFGDFEHYTNIGKNVENPTFEEVEKKRSFWNPSPGIQNPVQYVLDNRDNIVFGNIMGDSGAYGDLVYYEILPEELSIYNFYLGQEIEGVAEKGTADAYLKSIYDRLKDRHEGRMVGASVAFADKYPVSASALSVFQNLASGAEFIGDAARYVGSGMKGEMDDNSLARYSSAIRGTVSDKVDWEIGSWDAFDFVYNTTMSGIDSAVAMGTLGMGGGAALGLSAAAQGTNDALDRGLDSKHAFWNGIFSGVFEGLFESVSIGNFKSLKDLPVDGFKTYIKNIGKSMLVNASEETLTEVANVLYDTISNGDFSQYETDIRAYMSAGMSEEDAKRKVALEQGARIAEAGASGALMGFGFGAVGGATSYRKTSATGKSIRANERTSDMFDIASNPEIGSAYETYTQYANQGINAENAKNAQLGRLYMEAESDARNTLSDKKATDLQKSMALKNLGELSIVETENELKKKAAEEFNVGEETKVTKTGETIATKNIKVEGDKITIATENGKVSVDDVTLSERDAELAFVAKEIAKENGEDIANLFLEQYDGKTNVEAYQNSFNMVMQFAKGDFTFEEMMKHKGSLSATEVSKIYEETVLRAYKEQQSKIEKLIQDTADQKFYKGSIDESAITNKVWKKLDTRQRKAITFIKGLAKATGMNLVLTYNPDAKTGGSFEKSSNTITIDVAKFKDNIGVLRETIIPTMSHEMTHWMEEKSPELYRKLSDLVFSTLQEADGMSESARLDLEYVNQKANGIEYSNKDLRSEIVARACEDMLSMSEYGQKLFNSLSEAEKKTLGAKIKEIFHNIMDMIKEMLGTYKSDTYEAKMLREYQDKLQEIAKIWDEMLEKSVVANQALEKSGVFGELTNGISEDGTTIIGENALQMSDRTYRDGGREFLINWLNEKSGLSDADKRNIVEQTDKIAELMRAIENEEDLPDYSKWANMEVVKDENGEKVVSVIVKNGDYSMNIDFSQVCKKRVALNSVLNAMVKSGDLNVHTLTETDVAELNAIIKSHDFEIACALCFVDAKRYRVGSWAESFCEGSDDKNVHKYGFNEMVRSLIPKNSKIKADEFNFTGRDIKNQPTKNLLSDAKDSELDFSLIDEIMANNDSKSAQHRYAKAIKENSELRKILNSAEIISSIGLDAIRLEAPKLYGLINGHQGTAKPKFAHDVTAYGNDILKAKNFTPESAKMVGGVRVQSFSDFMANMIVDYVQLISELSAKQLTSHYYTKEALFVKLFGLTGMKINMSLVPKAVDLTEEQQKYFAILKDKNANKRSKEYKQKLEEYNALAENAGLDENGDYIWEDESFPYDIAMEIQVDPRYSANCGTIAVGISNKHILKLLDDDRISMVIPYHKSSLNHEVAMMRDIALYKDYTDVQNTRSMATGKKLDSKKGEIDFDFYGDLYGTDGKEGTHDPKQTAKNYLKWCDENNYIPKFDEFRGHKNYYKLLIDFRVYDTDGTYREQQAVQPIYPSEDEFQDLILNGVIGKDGTVYGGLKQQQETSDKLSNESQQIVEEFKQRLKDKYGKDVLNSDRDSETQIQVNMGEDERYEVLKDKKIAPVPTVTDESIEIDFQYLENNIKSVVEKSLLKKFQQLGLFKKYTSIAVDDVYFDFTGKGFRKSLHSQENFYGGNKADFAKVLLNLQELLDSSLLIESHTDKGKGTPKEKRGLEKVYVLFSALKHGETITPVQFEIEQYISDENRLYLAVALTKIETGVKGNTAPDEQKATSLLPISNISISEIFAKINPIDKNFLKYIPNQFLNEEQIQAKNEAIAKDKAKYSNSLFSDRNNVGYHAGDLGKAESLGSQGYGRDTGHFGRGTYFVGNKELVKDYNNRNGVPAPQHAVDFSNYNLYKIKSDQDGYDLHRQLRIIDGGINKDWVEYANNSEYSLYRYTEFYDIAEEKFGEERKYTDEALIYGLTELSKKANIKIPTAEQYSEESGYDLNDEYFESVYLDHLKNVVEEKLEDVNEEYFKFRDAYSKLQFRFGFNKVYDAMNKVLDYQNTNRADTMDAYKKDSLATIFMKALGYEGVDTRGTALDNTAYGSVIYDLREDSVLYSDRETVSVYDILGERERIDKEIEQFKAEIENLKERVELEKKVTNGTVLNNNLLLAAAAHLRNIANSNMDKVELARALKEVYSFILTSKELTWEEVFERCYNVADAMLKEAKPKVEVNEFYKGIVADIKKTKVSFSESQKMEARHAFDKNWNRYFFGRITLANDGIPLESMWAEWSQQYPDIFKSEITDGDMVRELYDVLGALQSASEIAMEYDETEQKRWLANEIYNQYWNVSTVTTTADKYDKQIKLLKSKHRSYMAEVRESYKSRMDEKLKTQHKADKEKASKLYKNLRERKDKEIALAKERGKERLAKYKEGAERKTYIQRITANALTLNKWLLKNNKDYHIHEAMKGPIIKLLNAIDFSSKSMLEKGEQTQKDVTFAKAFSDVKTMLNDATNMVVGLEELYGHDLAESIQLLTDAALNRVGDNSYIINTMNNEELFHLDKMIRHFKSVVTRLNEFHVLEHNKGVVNLGNEFMEHGKKLGNIKNQHGTAGKFLKFRNRTPYYFFKDLGPVGEKLFLAFRKGWDKLAFNAKKVIDYAEETYTTKEVQEWSKETKQFTIAQPDGSKRTFEMSIAQIMALHCVSKQNDARTHLFSGGMTLKRIDKKGHVISDYENISLSVTDLQNILETLTDRQKEVADKLQKFMNTVCSDWGNEISMARFGIKMFGIPDYFPIKVSEATVPTDNTKDIDNASLFRLLNMSFTKSRVTDASQSIEIGDVFDIFAQHSSDMAKYNALALPVLDFNKFYSIKGRDSNGKEYGVVQTLKSVFGDEANGYIRRFVRDLNSSQNVSRDVIGNTFFKNAKVASVAANLRVVLLQPTAYLKASAVMDNKYLLKAKAYIKVEPIGMVKKLKKAIENAEKYCGIVQWKSLGYYDTDISKGITEKIKHADSIKDKVIEKAMKGAELADKTTFGTLWVACEFEIRDTRKDLKVGSEEYYKAIADRLSDVIYATQVVDSTMTRSDMMRSSDGRDKMLTTFGSEPTIAYNMLLDLVTQTQRDSQEFGAKEAFKKNGNKIRKVVTAYVITNAMAALVESAFDALRDDDDEEMDVEQFLKLYFKNFGFDISIGNKLPYIKELYSIMQGYSSSRMDTQWATYLFKVYDGFSKHFEGKGDWKKTLKNTIKGMSDLTGLPAYNVYRDAMSILEKLNLIDW